MVKPDFMKLCRLLLLPVCAVSVLFTGCRESHSGKYASHPFPVPEIPAMISSGADALEYLVLNYWSVFTDTTALYPCDSSLVNGVIEDDVEQALANWISLAGRVDGRTAAKGMSALFDGISACEYKDTSSTVFEIMAELVEKYLYDPNSPVRNEDLYQVFATGMAGSPWLSPEERAVYEYDAEMCSLNATGTPAADFVFSDKYGRKRTLYGIKADYTLLFFSNPGCEACKYIIGEMCSDPVLESLVSSGKVAVANIYIDEDLQSWYGYQGFYPEEWYNGYDPDFIIRTDFLYNVRAIPSLYLLDRDKKVLLKDAPDAAVFSYLHQISGK